MEQKMFCYQCEQTVGCSACTGAAGVCGKKADTAKLQDKLTGALIGLARALDGDPGLATAQTNELVIESLFMTLTNVNFDNDSIQRRSTGCIGNRADLCRSVLPAHRRAARTRITT